MNQAHSKMQDDLRTLQGVLKLFADPKHPEVLRALEEYERSLVHYHSFVHKLEEIEYPDVCSQARLRVS